MVSGGHNKKPRIVKMLEGSYRADRDKVKQVPTRGKVVRPSSVKADPEASKHWDAIVKTRGDWLAKSDTAALQVLCELWAQSRQAYAELIVEPLPARFTRYEKLVTMWHKHAARFGLTPVDRERLGNVEPLVEQNRNRELEERYLG